MKSASDDKDEEKNVAVAALQDITHNLSIVLHQAKDDVSENIEDFVVHKISKLFRLVGIYSKAFKELNVGTKKDFERKVGSFFKDGLIQELFDELLQNEKEINDLLLYVDGVLSSSEQTLKEGDVGPLDVPVISARSGEKVYLRQFVSEEHLLAEVIEAKGKILIVSFGEADGASRWIEDNSCSYEMVLDPDRKIYTAFGLFRSVSKVWSISCLMYYAEQVVAGRELPKPYENVHDDPIQMGGDFVLDGQGVVQMFYPSKISMDRPSVDQILSVLKSQV